MIFFRLSILAVGLSLGACSFSKAPEPQEFRLSADALNQKYPARRTTEAGRLYAGVIETGRDDAGNRMYRATGGALYVIDAVPPIQVMAPGLTVTPESCETYGKATVKMNDRLYIGYDATKFRLEGTTLKPDGAHLIRKISAEAEPAAEAEATAPAPAVAEPAPPPAPKRNKPKAAAKPKAKKSSPPSEENKPKETQGVDRPRLLNLMREPTER
ncbi:hypothetical protein [Prosthecobacter sp.]|uniref:hypothetical protein n=1 Tax=Prosthecobacter sp. TaxID=1965333 RepID=UPI003783428F